MRSAWERQCAGPLCLPARALSSASGGTALGGVREPTYRLYNCQRCAVQVRICLRCDHGNIYCAGECAGIRRRESQRRAQARYQQSRRGATRHAARQRRWRQRHGETPMIVTHHGSPVALIACMVRLSLLTASQPTDANCAALHQHDKICPPPHCCAFCGAPLPQWSRQRPWRWSD